MSRRSKFANALRTPAHTTIGNTSPRTPTARSSNPVRIRARRGTQRICNHAAPRRQNEPRKRLVSIGNRNRRKAALQLHNRNQFNGTRTTRSKIQIEEEHMTRPNDAAAPTRTPRAPRATTAPTGTPRVPRPTTAPKPDKDNRDSAVPARPTKPPRTKQKRDANYRAQDYQDASATGNHLIATFLATPGNRERAQETSNRLLQKATLATIRRSRSLTQTQLAQALGVSQSRVVEIEHQQDLQLSTLARYAQATGGTINIEINYPDGTRIQLNKAS